ncbi:RNA 2',3'-cyclic phosphodiesterase [Ideonella sp. BN130291]|uniref:RNA 2',3'-cyclic phosphodiesterase n=1 Tax=Ideonella sp. BN130291 TaxID=3112940 RepID=UPI002E253A48|nr:RNA 2',3'-cyclic phosphodiesterase [Ideonella sp. BN130291]
MDTARLFLALWPDEAIRAHLARAQATLPWPAGARPTLAENLHATLHFIGAVPSDRLVALIPALAVPPRRIELQLDRLELWPNGIAAWVPGTTPAALRALHGELEERLRDLQLPVEARPYRPHVTLARRATGLDSRTPGALPPLQWHCDGHALVESAAGRYRVLHRYDA